MFEDEGKPQWLSISRVLNFFWIRIFTVPGGCIAFAVASFLGFSLKPPTMFLDYIVFPFVTVLALFLIALLLITTAMIGDFIAETIISKIIRKPNPSCWKHQAIYILCTIPCYSIAILFMLMIRLP